jgi:lipopolysaccharide biosynthesis glycosyltransferase
MSKIDIVLTADNNYTDIIAITMFSILKNLPKDCTARFFIFSHNFQDEDLKRLNLLKRYYSCEIINIPVDEYLYLFDFFKTENFKNKWISLACYFRLLMFKFLPDDVENCFYVDGDMIIDTDLSKIKLSENKIIKAVIEPIAMQYRESILKHCYEIEEFQNFAKEPLIFPYFNAGFFLVNIKKAKDLEIFEQIMTLLKKYPALPYCDQDLLNLVFGQKYSSMLEFSPPDYNVFTDISYEICYDKLPYKDKVLKEAVKNPKIIHYAGSRKPWGDVMPLHYSKVWHSYWRLSPYKTSYIKFALKHFAQNVFSVKYEYSHNTKRKVVKILSIKIKFKTED